MKCRICFSKMRKYDKYYECESCGFIAKGSIISELEEKERYLEHQYDEGYKNYMFNHLKDMLKDKNGTILDFGCGHHPVLDELFPSLSFTFYDYYFYNNPYKNKRYDIILLNEVIEHLSNPLDILHELKDLLNDDGIILIHTSLYSKEIDINKWWYFRDKTHISFFTIESFKAIASNLDLSFSIENKFIILKKYNT